MLEGKLDRIKAVAILKTIKQILTDTPWCKSLIVQTLDGKELNLEDVKNGKHEGEYQVCVLGAYELAIHKHQETCSLGTLSLIGSAARQKTGNEHISIIRYNDRVAESKDDIMQLIDTAIEIGEKEIV